MEAIQEKLKKQNKKQETKNWRIYQEGQTYLIRVYEEKTGLEIDTLLLGFYALK